MTLDEWIVEHLHEIKEAQDFSVDAIPDEPATMGQHLSMAVTLYPRTGKLLADAEGFLLKAHAVSVMEVRRVHSDMTADERKVMAKADPDYLKALELRDSLSIIVSALKAKSFAIMNTRNNTLTPAMQGQRD